VMCLNLTFHDDGRLSDDLLASTRQKNEATNLILSFSSFQFIYWSLWYLPKWGLE
jgi:hypothetical protein